MINEKYYYQSKFDGFWVGFEMNSRILYAKVECKFYSSFLNLKFEMNFIFFLLFSTNLLRLKLKFRSSLLYKKVDQSHFLDSFSNWSSKTEIQVSCSTNLKTIVWLTKERKLAYKVFAQLFHVFLLNSLRVTFHTFNIEKKSSSQIVKQRRKVDLNNKKNTI